MRLMRRFLQISWNERYLLAKALLALVFVRLWLPLASLERLQGRARPARGAPQPVARIVWAVRTAAHLVPGTHCLPASLVLQRWLTAAGHRSELHIGVAHERDRLAAHAWVVCDGEVLIGDPAQTAFTSLLSWD
jgi:hypothetical protein